MSWTDYTIDRIKTAKIIDDPFPHIVVYKVFPAGDYVSLLMHRSKEGMEVLSPARPRLILWMSKSKIAFWSDFWSEAAALKPALEAKFSLPQGSKHDAQLLCDDPGYELGPHTDIPEKMLTGIFYLPNDDVGKQHGTALYRSEQRCPGNRDHDFGPDFEKVVTVPYTRNTALFFPCHDQSWHAVEPTPIERWVISFDILR